MGVMEESFSYVNKSLNIGSQKNEKVELTSEEKRKRDINLLRSYLKIAKGVDTNKTKHKKRKKKKR